MKEPLLTKRSSSAKETTLRSVRAIAGRETVPQVFIGGHHIGGAEELEQYFAENSRDAA